jgi:hypothetical protein
VCACVSPSTLFKDVVFGLHATEVPKLRIILARSTLCLVIVQAGIIALNVVDCFLEGSLSAYNHEQHDGTAQACECESE